MGIFSNKENIKITDKPEETYSLPPIYYVSTDPGDGLWQSSTNTHLQTDVVLTCVNIRSDIIASLPLKVFQKQGQRIVEIDHPLSNVFLEPNQFQTDFDFMSYIQMSLDLHGNAYVQKILNGKGNVIEMIPLNPEGMTLEIGTDGKLYYTYDGITLPQDQVLHVKNIGSSIYAGDSTISLLTNTVNAYLYAQGNIKNSHKNGPQLKGVIESSAPIRGDSRQSLEDKINSSYSGTGAGKTLVLSNGLTWKSVGMSANDAQTLQSMTFNLERICSVFRIPPQWMYSANVKPSYASNEANTQDFITHAVRPLCKRYETAFNRYLLPLNDRKNGIFFKFDLNSLLRADLATRYDSYVKGIQGGFLSPNEARELENRQPIEGGEKPFRPLNMVYLGEDESVTDDNTPESSENNEPPTN